MHYRTFYLFWIPYGNLKEAYYLFYAFVGVFSYGIEGDLLFWFGTFLMSLDFS